MATVDVEGTQLKNYGAAIVIENNWFYSGMDDCFILPDKFMPVSSAMYSNTWVVLTEKQ
jgi:hypothetical protein